MKKIYLLIVVILWAFGLQAQVEKTIENTAGNLTSMLTPTELTTITDLTINGTMDARDFRILRDQMPQLVNLDLRQASIEAYSGSEGTYLSGYSTYYTYDQYTLPFGAFAHFEHDTNNTLQSVQIPLNTTVIGQSAFSTCTGLTSFTVPPSVTSISQDAFYECTGLTAITIPSTVTFLGWGAFVGCTSLKEIVIPPGINNIRESLFRGCSALTSVVLPSTITIIEKWAFAGCGALVTLNFPEALTSIGANAFEGCSSLESLTIPGSVTFIGEYAFDGCSGLKGSLNLPRGLKTIRAFAFRRCSSLSSVQLPFSLDSIRTSAFENCNGLSGPLSLPTTLKLIENRAFNNCSGFSGALILPPLVTTVEEHAFAGCSGFNSLTIPSSIHFINSGAFSGCAGLNTINAESVKPVPLNDVSGVFEGVDKINTMLKVPFGTKEAYAAEGWKEFTNITEGSEGVLLSATALNFSPEGGSNNTISLKANVTWTALSNMAWLSVSPSSGNNTQQLTITAETNPTNASRTATVTITAPGVESQVIHVNQKSNPVVIQSLAGHLKEIMTEEQLKTITHLTITGTMDARDFSTIKNLMPLLAELDLSGVTITPYYELIMMSEVSYPANTIPGSSEYYSNYYALRNMTNLTSILLPSTTKRIGSYAFEGCIKLANIEIPPSVISIDEYAFKDCKALTSCKIPSSVVHLGDGVFNGCSNLASVELPEGMSTLSVTFADCSSLRNIKLPGSLKEIGRNAFSNCSSLAGVELPPMVTAIGPNAFSGCIELSTVSFSQCLKIIDSHAFSGCVGLTSVTIPSTITYIAPGAFCGCTSLQTIYAYPVQPPKKEVSGYEDIFSLVDKANCKLYVPAGSEKLYAQAEDWKGFTSVLELKFLWLSANSFTMDVDSSNVSVKVTSADSWTASSNAPWVTVTPASGSATSTVTLSIATNATSFNRVATITFTAGSQAPQLITVAQTGNTANINLTAGSLNSMFTTAELKSIQRLVIKGTMDARDFKTISDKMISLTELDLTEASIAAYSGSEGTQRSMQFDGGERYVATNKYAANEVPPFAFYGNCSLITSVKLPTSITSIGNNAFMNLTLLTKVTIPPTVSYIGMRAFQDCASLKTLTLPPAITQIKNYMFYNSKLMSINIPSGVSSIEQAAFCCCDSLTSIYSYALYPPELISLYDWDAQVFFRLDKSKCTLHVPYGSRELYAKTPDEWKDFHYVVEMPGFRLSAVTKAVKAAQGSMARVAIKSDVPWTATADQSWLTISTGSGTEADTLIFTAQANELEAGRMATVTISAPGVVSQTITVIQEGKPRTITLSPGNMASVFTVDEMSGITNLTIKGTIDARDFRIMRDKMPLLTFLDLSGVSINKYGSSAALPGDPYKNAVNQIPDSAFFDQKNGKGKTSLTTVILPNTMELIGARAFSHAAGLTSIKLPYTMKHMKINAFNSCPFMDTIYSYTLTPSSLWGITLYNIDKTNCVLYVPFGSKALYAEAYGYKEFKNIVEMAEFKVMPIEATLKVTSDIVHLKMQSQVAWTAEASEQWITVTPVAGNGDQLITINAEANPSEMLRTATVTFKAAGNLLQIFTVTQEGLPKTVDLSAGSLALRLSPEEKKNITSLVITGTMDASDFKTIRDQMPWLSFLDLTGARIVAYSGSNGTYAGYNKYTGDAIPGNALMPEDFEIDSKVRTLLLPASLKLFSQFAFQGANALTSITIPPLVTSIGDDVFYGCGGLQKIHIPEGVSSIGINAFTYCFNLHTLSIPSTVKFIAGYAFSNLMSLDTIYSYAPIPLDLTNSPFVFSQIYKDSCILMVPYGSKALYAAADQWRDFPNIVEMSEGQSLAFDQRTVITGVDETTTETTINCYPNPFTREMVIAITNPSYREINVEIYTISGQKIKTLAKAQKGQKISCTWNGRDEGGKMMPDGMYLLKVNRDIRKVVKR